MEYSELIKDYSKIRNSIRDFYVYGFRSRNEFTSKSSRSYDNDKRRIASWLNDNIRYNSTASGKNVYISVDTRVALHNPLYRAFKAKSFTNKDITTHFLILDILENPDVAYTCSELMDIISVRFQSRMKGIGEYSAYNDATSLRKKLKEYEQLGILKCERRGNKDYYSRVTSSENLTADALNFYSEIAPCGVVGSYLLDKRPSESEAFRFKHHYINAAVDSEVLYQILTAISEHRRISKVLEDKGIQETFVPLKIYVSVQTGRQYVMGYSEAERRIKTWRIAYISKLILGEIVPEYGKYLEVWNTHRQKFWGVSTGVKHGRRRGTEHVEFVVTWNRDEEYILGRLFREKRVGEVVRLSETSARFTCDVVDSNELLPWIRTFICRINELKFSNKQVEARFREDLDTMYQMYDVSSAKEVDSNDL